jgi:glycosyltransferase involved in cell wall biosynthesis
MTPVVSVLLPIYRGAAYLRQTLDGLMAQSFRDFEVIAVNDASPDDSRDIVLSYEDPRITLIDNPVNAGQTASMQRALERARGRYIARQDQDDISLPPRFEQQVRYLDKRSDIGAVGTDHCVIDEHAAPVPGMSTSYPEETVAEMGWRLLCTDRLVDSTVMFRTDIARRLGGFDVACRYAQDYDLWAKFSFTTGVARLREELLQFRIHRSSASVTYSEAQAREVAVIVQRNLNLVLSAPVDLAAAGTIHRVLSEDPSQSDGDDVWLCARILEATIDPYCRQRALGRSDRVAVAAAFSESLVKLGLRHRHTLGASMPALLAKAGMKSPALFLDPGTLRRWWKQGRQSSAYRAAVRSLVSK